MKKTLATLFMVLALFCAMTTTSFAADNTAKIIISNTTTETGINLNGKTFNVYQIFSATVSDVTGVGTNDAAINYELNSEYVDLFEILLGETQSDDESAFEAAAENYIGALDAADMQTFAAVLQAYVTDEDNSINATSTISGSVHTSDSVVQTMTSEALYPGYYLVLDVTDYSETSANSAAMLITIPEQGSDGNFTGDGTLTLKGSQPSIDKEIWHNDLNTTGGWDNVGDYEIGDTVKFRITATVPQDVNGYDTYTYVITDTWSEGLKFTTESIKIYLDADLTNPAPLSLHDEDVNDASRTFTLTFNMLDIIANYPASQTFYIVYEATITDDVDMALNYETNEVELKYSNNPYDSTSFGYATDTVYSYSFQFDVTKTNSGGTPLAAATFGLWVSTPGESTSEYQVFLLAGDDNVYYVQQTGTPSDTEGVITTGESGKFTIKGLDDSLTYILREIDAPDGYTAADDLTFVITADYGDGTIPAVSTNRNRITVTNGVLSTTIINTSSSLFPGTGGIGTTIFMVAGCGLMAAAAFMLISNRRRHN